MDKIKTWSKFYRIPPRIMEQLYHETKEYRLRANRPLAFKILGTNSLLVYEFIRNLPEPREEMQDYFALAIDLIYPCNEGWEHILRSRDAPLRSFEHTSEITTMFWDDEGIEFDYARGLPKVNDVEEEVQNVPVSTYIQAVGFWQGGMRRFCDVFLPLLLEENYLIHSIAIGERYDARASLLDLSHRVVGVADSAINYECSQDLYDTSSYLSVQGLEHFFTRSDAQNIETTAEKLNELFFSRFK